MPRCAEQVRRMRMASRHDEEALPLEGARIEQRHLDAARELRGHPPVWIAAALAAAERRGLELARAECHRVSVSSDRTAHDAVVECVERIDALLAEEPR
jgi:hypothetical protein